MSPDCRLLRQHSGGHRVTASTSIVKLEVETSHIGCTVFMDGGLTLLDSEALP